MAIEENNPVRYEGGPLDGVANSQDYGYDSEMQVGAVFDFPTRMATGTQPTGEDDTVERYLLEERDGAWVFVHTGVFTQPPIAQAFTAEVVGGPQDGRTRYLLGTARRWEGLRCDHVEAGCVLAHAGDDPADGWQLLYTSAA